MTDYRADIAVFEAHHIPIKSRGIRDETFFRPSNSTFHRDHNALPPLQAAIVP
jgi:hypothetical protein